MTGINILGTLFVFYVAFVSSGVASNSQEVITENIRKLTVANNELAFNLHRKIISNSSKNVFFSPLSLSTDFGMLFYGAKGDTAEELRKALGYEKADLPNDVVHVTFNRFFSDIINTKDTSNGLILKAANAILVDKRIELIEKYRSNVKEFYEAVIRDLDFSRSTSETVEEINTWVKENTDGKIEKLFDDLSPSNLMVLLNAMYFKGTWKTQFDPEETVDEIFLNNGIKSEGRRVPLMHMTSLFQYDSTNNYQVLELPFKGETISMLILLPNKHDGLHFLEDSLTPEKLTEIMKELEETKVDVSLPKFKLDFDEELSEEIQALGVNHIFNADGDFSGMTPSTSVFVSEIRHKAIIEVNEEGSEAAAVTGNLIDRMKSPQFRADHPFFLAIVEKRSNMILFMGRVNNF